MRLIEKGIHRKITDIKVGYDSDDFVKNQLTVIVYEKLTKVPRFLNTKNRQYVNVSSKRNRRVVSSVA